MTLQQFLAHPIAIIICCSHEIEALVYKNPWAQIWVIVKAIYDAFFPIMITCVINKYCEYWLWWSNFLLWQLGCMWNFPRINWSCKHKLMLMRSWTCTPRWTNSVPTSRESK
jgi:hypothetical protein